MSSQIEMKRRNCCIELFRQMIDDSLSIQKNEVNRLIQMFILQLRLLLIKVLTNVFIGYDAFQYK